MRQHFWDPATGSCGWMTEDYAPIRRVFTPADLASELKTSGVDATVLVQTWHDLQETEDFLTTAAKPTSLPGSSAGLISPIRNSVRCWRG